MRALESRIVARIFEDLRDRSGLKHMFASGDAYQKIDNETQAEIRKAWRKIIREELKTAETIPPPAETAEKVGGER